ncbi:MAG: phosphatase PAP2 family protein [Parcubacteria group bacterium]|nr:phosphatase PAP2 family protein [Parcubacteria group bacterium]
MNEFLLRLLNVLVGRFDALDSLIYFLAQPAALIATLALGAYALYEIAKTRGSIHEKEVARKWVFIFTAAVLAWLAAGVVKGLIASPRPFLELRDVNLLFPHGDRDSFPSGHAAFLSGLAAAFYFFSAEKKLAWILLLNCCIVKLLQKRKKFFNNLAI